MSPETIHLVNIAAPFRSGVADLRRPPSGILYVGGYLKAHGWDVRVHHIDEGEIEATAREIASDGSALFAGFSLMTGRQVTTSFQMSRRLKQLDSTLPLVWGGIHPSLMPRECLDFGVLDYVVVGEGEATALDLATHLKSGRRGPPVGMPGVVFVTGGELVVGPERPFAADLDEFCQDWSLVDAGRYVRKEGARRVLNFITSRGCPHSCGFCYNQTFNLRRWRGHSVERVVGEVARLSEELGVDRVCFDDDNFFTDQRRGLKILRRLRELGVTCNWLELRIDYIREELIEALVALGVETIFTGWESGSARTLHRISKGFNPDKILEKTRILARYRGLNVDASAILGFPWETEQDIADTQALMLKMFEIKPFGMNFNLGVYVPYPGSPVTRDAIDAGFAFPKDPEAWSRYDILAGTMSLPWLESERVRRYTLIDRFAKLLCVNPKTPPLRRLVLYLIAVSAYVRLRTGFLGLPVEVSLMEWYGKRQLLGAT